MALGPPASWTASYYFRRLPAYVEKEKPHLTAGCSLPHNLPMSKCDDVFPDRARAAIPDEWTRQEVADEIGFSLRALMAWLSGKNLPVSGALVRFCLFTGSSADYLLGLRDTKPRR